jgi:predicted flap endonuclease-1-like 5' DNA nuclease
MDERLDAFKGRIARDNWVSQALHLRSAPDASRMPAE